MKLLHWQFTYKHHCWDKAAINIFKLSFPMYNRGMRNFSLHHNNFRFTELRAEKTEMRHPMVKKLVQFLTFFGVSPDGWKRVAFATNP